MEENAARPLPPADSPTLALTSPSTIEKHHIDLITGESWKGRLSLPAYLRREDFLAQQALTCNGGITVWILIDTAEPTPPNGQPRRILSSCETIRKRAFVKASHGALKEVTSHSIGSVFCNSEYRRRGYTKRMMRELGHKLDTWQPKEGQTIPFTVLYSDIGKVRAAMPHITRSWRSSDLVVEILLRRGVEAFPLDAHIASSFRGNARTFTATCAPAIVLSFRCRSRAAMSR